MLILKKKLIETDNILIRTLFDAWRSQVPVRPVAKAGIRGCRIHSENAVFNSAIVAGIRSRQEIILKFCRIENNTPKLTEVPC